MKSCLIEIKNLTVHHPKEKNAPVRDFSLQINEDEILGLVGASGCGKSTIAKTLVGLNPISKGEIYYRNQLICSDKKDAIRFFRKEIQIVFQDPAACLNPRMSVFSILEEPLAIHEKELTKEKKLDRICLILEQVGLLSSHLKRYPHELSGGQRQRVCIARSLILQPKFLIFDEAVSALDASIQAQVLNLLKRLKNELGFTLLFISHDLQIIHFISDRIAVMDQGKIGEINTPYQIFNHPIQPYTQRLIELSKRYMC